MKFFKYGIILERLKEEDIELVRGWRNSNQVRLNMNYQEIITSKQQRSWFESINTLKFNYMMIYYQGKKIGLLNDKNIDWEAKTSESGIFLGHTEYYSTFVPYLVSIAGIETTFYLLCWEKQYAHIMKANTNAIRFNMQLGYHLSNAQENEYLQQFELTRQSFEEKAEKIRKAVRSLVGNDISTKALFEPEDYHLGLAQRFECLLKSSMYPYEQEETNEGVLFTVKEDVVRKK